MNTTEAREEPMDQTQNNSSGDAVDLTRYVAKHVRQFYEERNGEPLTEPVMKRNEFGVVAMADVSGYSHLTNHLKNRNNGAELLTQLLNPYFHFVIDIIEKSGGDVVKFIGDAILVKWDAKGQSKAECVALACSGCLRLLERLGNHQLTIPDEEKTFPLSMHIGLGVGEVYDLHLGTSRHKRWEYFLDGKSLQEAVRLVNIASQRELAISTDTLTYMQGEAAILQAGIKGITTEKINGGYILKSLKWLGENDGLLGLGRKDHIPSKPIYRMYINESAVERLLAGHVGLINELRKVTVMFMRFSAPDKTPDESRLLYQKAMAGTQDILRSYEGTLRQMVTDDKGTSILTVFGLPPLSHENDALFGLRAALDTRRLLQPLFSSYSIAVTSGALFSGIVGGRTRADHTIMGEVVNLAARLMIADLCQNTIYCDEETRDGCSKEVSFDENPIEFVTKKGKAIVYRVLGLLRENTTLTSKSHHTLTKTLDASGHRGSHDSLKQPDINHLFLVGREPEVAKIAGAYTDFLQGAATSTPPKIIIEGEGGTGKSTMFNYAVKQAELNHLPASVGKGDEVDQSTPFFAFRDLIADILDLINDQLPDIDEEEEASLIRRASDRYSDRAMSDMAKEMRSSTSMSNMSNMVGKIQSGQKIRTVGRSRSLYMSLRMTGQNLEKILAEKPPNGSSSENVTNVKSESQQNVAVVPPSPIAELNPDKTDMSQNDILGALFMRRVTNALAKLGLPTSLAQTVAMVYSVGEQGRTGANFMPRAGSSKMTLGGIRTRSSSGSLVSVVPSTKLDALADVLVRMINKMTIPTKAIPGKDDHTNSTPILPNGLVLAIDDAQWLDALSWNLIGILSRRCNRLLLTLCLRPFTRNMPDAFARIRSSPETCVLTLGGLSKEAVSKLVASIYGDQVRTVQERLLESIMDKTGGNPLFVNYIATGMKGQRYLGVTPTFELYSKARKEIGNELDSLMPKDLQSAMLVQFDRLEPSLQMILRVASVIGHNFTLEMVTNIILRERKITLQESHDKLTSAEAMSFVGFEPVQNTPGVLYNMFFKSALLQKCVYSTMLFTERAKLHMIVAQLYEAQLTPDNRPQYLPIILYHYERTNNIFKRIEFLEAVAELHIINDLFADAAVALKKLLNSLTMLEAEKKVIFTNDRRARWHKNLGLSYVALYEWELGRGHLIEALRYMEVSVPPVKNALRWATMKALTKQNKYWAKRNSPDKKPEIVDPLEIDRTAILVEILAALGDAFLYLSETDAANWCVLTRLNYCEALGEAMCNQKDLQFARVEAVAALSLQITSRMSQALEYFSRAEQIANRSDNPIDLVYVNLYKAQSQFALGNIKDCIRYHDTGVQVLDMTGLRKNDIVMSSVALDIMTGQTKICAQKAKDLFEDSSDHGEDVYSTLSAMTMALLLDINPKAKHDDGIDNVANWLRVVLGPTSDYVKQLGTSGALYVLGTLGYHFSLQGDSSRCVQYFEAFAMAIHANFNTAMAIVATPGFFFQGLALLKWHAEGCPVEADFQVGTHMLPPTLEEEHSLGSDYDAFGSALAATGIHAQGAPKFDKGSASKTMRDLSNTVSSPSSPSHSWGASVGDRALKSSLSREGFDSLSVASADIKQGYKSNRASSVSGSSVASNAAVSYTMKSSLDHTNGRALYLSYVRGMIRVLKPLRKTWVMMNTLYYMYDALDHLDHGSTEKASALLEKAALTVPQGLYLIKIFLMVEALALASVPKAKKAVQERRRRLEELADQAKQLGLPNMITHINTLIAQLPSAP